MPGACIAFMMHAVHAALCVEIFKPFKISLRLANLDFFKATNHHWAKDFNILKAHVSKPFPNGVFFCPPNTACLREIVI